MIAGRPSRIAIVGATSLAGKELSDALAESLLAASDVLLLDAEDAAGQVTAAGDEVTFIQKIAATNPNPTKGCQKRAVGPPPRRKTIQNV